MPTWLWVVLVVVVALAALVWWSSGRASSRRPGSTLTANQREQRNITRMQHDIRPGNNPNNPGGR